MAQGHSGRKCGVCLRTPNSGWMRCHRRSVITCCFEPQKCQLICVINKKVDIKQKQNLNNIREICGSYIKTTIRYMSDVSLPSPYF